MRKTILTSVLLSAFCLNSLTAYSISDRLDFYKKDGSFISFMTEDIKKITYLPSENGETFSSIQILFYNNETTVLNIADYTEVKYEGISTDWLEITSMGDEHSRVIMLDCINNEHIMRPDKPLDWVAEKPYGTPHFLYEAELGFDASISIEGKLTGNVYSDREGFIFWSEKTENLLGRDCWSFFMPNEPIYIKSKAKERTTYLGKDFVGTYNGFLIHAEPSLVFSSSQPNMTLELKSNEAYTVTSTDENKLDVFDLYEFDEDNQTFAYQDIPREESDMGDYNIYYGAIGKMTDGFCFVDMVNKTENRPENTFRYCIAKDGFSINYAAADLWGTKYLVETKKPNGEKKHFFLYDYGNVVKSATLTFLTGSEMLSEGSKAIISYDNEPQWMYTYENSTPKFTQKGSEAGTFNPENGTDAILTLDGFGNATYAGKSYTYTAEGMVITLTINGQVRIFIVDTIKNTYKEMVSDTWNGPEYYENTAINGQFQGTPSTSNKARLTLDKDLMGNAAPGMAALQISMRNEFFSWTDIVAAVEKYIYNAENKTITVTNVLMGDANGFNGRKNITFKLSDDLTKAYLEGEGEAVRVYQAAAASNYVIIDQENALTGALPAGLAPKYEGKATISSFGHTMEEPQPITLWIDQDLDGNAKEGYATLKMILMDVPFFNQCVEYTFDNKKLTLKRVTVGDGNYGQKQEDIVFTMEADGSLQGSGTYYGTDMMTGTMEVLLSTCKLTAVSQ